MLCQPKISIALGSQAQAVTCRRACLSRDMYAYVGEAGEGELPSGFSQQREQQSLRENLVNRYTVDGVRP